ncbi:MAG: PilZ domain-containing protein [Nitrospirae bacterium]|nr:MAG: PilZ domain-containing protein [Nitrospirota bacterium]
MMTARKYERYPVQLLVHLFGDLGGDEGTTVNIGMGGCAVAGRSPREKGNYVSLVMRASHDQLPIKIELAIVRWAKDDVFGVEFIRMKPEQRTRLGHYLHVLDLSHGR